ncbi:elongation factor G [Kiloniella sp.]|uniref:elongation factor G n=1 Tax=Kiloniella sp. TaxID=1938587 RepID=UPI003B02D665
MPGSVSAAARSAAIVGPYLSGKTSVMEALLNASGTIQRRGSVKEKNTVGDTSPESRDRHMSVELSVARTNYLGDTWTLLDCPGSVEFYQDTQAALSIVDMAIVVCEPNPEKVLALAPLLHFLDKNSIPHLIFINKIDNSTHRVSEVFDALQEVSERPLILRQVPLREEGQINGYVDLISEKAYRYGAEGSNVIEMPDVIKQREIEARQEMLEGLADFDDVLLEHLLEDEEPTSEEIYELFSKDLCDDLVVPVLLGGAEHGYGINRLWKTLRHDCPSFEVTRQRQGLPEDKQLIQVFKTQFVPHVGKLSLSRIWHGVIGDGNHFGEHKVSGLNYMVGQKYEKVSGVKEGDIAALGRMEEIRSGEVLNQNGLLEEQLYCPEIEPPVYSLSIETTRHEDEVKLSTGLSRLCEEDPSLSYKSNPDTHELLLWGQGEIHLKVALSKLERQYNVSVKASSPKVAYKESIQKGTVSHARHKKQSGGHGEFGDVQLNIRPLSRGDGFIFESAVTGGSVPKKYIPAVHAGVNEYMSSGPLGFQVVDVAVTLLDGQHHAVDSSDLAFRKAGIMAMKEGMSSCHPVLLEPIYELKISIPNPFTSNGQALIARRRGQILGFDAKEGWRGWDEITALLPQAEMGELIIELRSQTQGIGTFSSEFAHMVELSGKLADEVINLSKAAAE